MSKTNSALYARTQRLDASTRTGARGHMFAAARADGLVVLTTHPGDYDGSAWLHVSLSFADRDPSYADLADPTPDFARGGDTI